MALVVETVGSTPQKTGARMLVFPDGSIEGTIGGGGLEKRVIDEALSAIEDQTSRLISIDLHRETSESIDAVCGGEVRVFIEPIGTVSRLIIFGAGHVGRALARLAQDLSLRVVVYDDREEHADPAQFPDTTKIVCGPFEDAMDRVQPTAQDYIVILTYDHKHDELVLHDALATPAKYVGMIGSSRKCRHVRERLLKQGISQAQLDRAHAPIGLPIGAHTPAEIAISIAGEIVKEMNQCQAP